jgi:putative tricarboxylic transport membrane protein
METLNNLALGFSVSLSASNLLFCFIGTVLGVLVGILPGLGSAATIAMLLPVTYYLDATAAIIMLAGIWYGSMFGGGVTSILLGVPGQSTAVMTVLDGHKLALRGEAGLALGTSTISSFLGGVIGFIGLIFIAPALADVALAFGPPEFFALTLVGLTLVSYLATDSTMKAIIAAVLGLLIGCVGIDVITAQQRLTFGSPLLEDGFGLIPLIVGLFGVAEVFRLLEYRAAAAGRVRVTEGFWSVIPNRANWRRIMHPTWQGGLVGFFVGLLPGAGAAIASYVSYVVVKRWSNASDQFGKGAVEGVAAPESANNAATNGDLIPLLTLGVPADIVPAIMLGAFLLHGVIPGPTMITERPDMFWGIVTSLFVGNLLILIFVLPLLSPLSRIVEVPSVIIGPMIALVTLAGAYAINNSTAEIWLTLGFGVLGYLMNKFDYPIAPLVLAFVLGPLMETSLRQSLIISRGNFGILLDRPVSAGLIAIACLVLASPIFRTLTKATRLPGLLSRFRRIRDE